jgi:branched-chain amino acid transport system substrate-binding protein
LPILAKRERIHAKTEVVGGKLGDKEALRLAIKKAHFNSVCWPFKFNNNGFPIQDFYLVKVAKRADGKFQTEIVQKVFENAGDSYASDCPLK